MKKTMALALTLCLLCASFLTGCGAATGAQNGGVDLPGATEMMPDPEDGKVQDTDGDLSNDPGSGEDHKTGGTTGNTSGNGASGRGRLAVPGVSGARMGRR